MPFYGLLLIFHYNSYLKYNLPEGAITAIYKVVIATTFVFPVICILIFKLKGNIQSLHLETTRERRYPFLLTAISYTLGYYLLQRLELPTIFNRVILGATLSVTLAVVITLKWKISVHSIGIGGLIGTLLAMSQILFVDVRLPLIISIVLAGIIGSARLSLSQHSSSQIYTGILVGFLSEFLILIINRY
jgi:hypothetical protein